MTTASTQADRYHDETRQPVPSYHSIQRVLELCSTDVGRSQTVTAPTTHKFTTLHKSYDYTSSVLNLMSIHQLVLPKEALSMVFAHRVYRQQHDQQTSLLNIEQSFSLHFLKPEAL